MNLLHIESRASKKQEAAHEFFVELDARSGRSQSQPFEKVPSCTKRDPFLGDVSGAVESVKEVATHLQLVSREDPDRHG